MEVVAVNEHVAFGWDAMPLNPVGICAIAGDFISWLHRTEREVILLNGMALQEGPSLCLSHSPNTSN